MKTLLLIALAALAGCATHRIEIQSFENNTRFSVVNPSGTDLHNLRLRIYVTEYGEAITFYSEERIGFLGSVPFDTSFRFKEGIHTVEIWGSSREGWIRGQYFGGVEAVEKPPP